MSALKKPNSAWMKNFTASLSSLIKEEKRYNNAITGIIISQDIYKKITKELGYKPVDILGYTLQIVDGEDGLVMIKGKPIN